MTTFDFAGEAHASEDQTLARRAVAALERIAEVLAADKEPRREAADPALGFEGAATVPFFGKKGKWLETLRVYSPRLMQFCGETFFDGERLDLKAIPKGMVLSNEEASAYEWLLMDGSIVDPAKQKFHFREDRVVSVGCRAGNIYEYAKKCGYEEPF